MVMTPEGRATSAARIAAGSPAAPFRTSPAAVGVRHRGESLGLDVLAADRAGRVAAGSQSPQRSLDLLQFRLGRARDGPKDIVVLALRHLLGEVGRKRIGFMPQVGTRLTGALAQFIATLEQSLPYRIGVHVSPPGRIESLEGGHSAATFILEPFLQLIERLDEFHDAFALELLCDSLKIDIEPLEPLANIARLGEVTLERELGAPQPPIRVESLEWHGVHSIRDDQLLDVFDRTVGRILGRSRRPQQPLRPRS